jgi:predicted metal-dependent phosphotriesterase family hydrolase
MIRTVLGDIAPDALGVTDSHDHLFFASACPDRNSTTSRRPGPNSGRSPQPAARRWHSGRR